MVDEKQDVELYRVLRSPRDNARFEASHAASSDVQIRPAVNRSQH
jgi:hypothetical protein